jgi:hypothetical protein
MNDDLEVASVWAAEEALLGLDVRRDSAALERLLAPEFHEIGQSGVHWNREQIVHALVSESIDVTPFELVERRADRVAPDLVLVTYRLDFGGRTSRRSSLWRLGAGGPTILFHQGTSI